MDLSTLFILLLIGVIAGIASGFVGIGGGLIIVPALIYFTGLDQHTAQGTSLAMMLPPIGIFAAMNYQNEQSIEWAYAACLAVTFIIGAWLGSKWSLKLSPTIVRLIFAGFMIYSATIMIIKSVKELIPNDGA